MAMIEVGKNEFEAKVLKAAGPVLVDFWAPWCGYCRRLMPLLEQVAGEFEGKMAVVKANVDELSDVANEYEIEVIPTLMLFENGVLKDRVVNPASRPALMAWLKDNGVQ